MKLISWNVNGLRACVGKGFLEIFQKLDADIFCLQETKMQAGQLDLDLPGYHQYYNYADKKGYSGTALFTKKEPLNVTYGIGLDVITKDVSLRRNLRISFLSLFMCRIHRTNWQD